MSDEAQQELNGDGAAEAEAPLAPGEPDLPGPFPVGRWAAGFRAFLRRRPRVRIMGEVVNCSASRKAVYFDLRDGEGAVPCAIWRTDLDKLDLPEGALADGVEIVAAGGPEYFPGGERTSPSFSFRVSYLRPAGEGDLLAQLERLRRQLASEGLFEPQKQLDRPLLPRSIGVVIGSESAAYGDILAGLERRSWRGRLVLAHPPVQGKAAAPKITAAVQELAAAGEVEAIIVSRGGGSLTDLWCFCDETLCRTVAMLSVPVISAVGHDVDRTLIDEVAAVACSTPTHAAETAVRLDVATARADLKLASATLNRCSRRAVAGRAERLGTIVRSLAGHMRREREWLHQKLRELRASSSRTIAEDRRAVSRYALVLSRRRRSTDASIDRGRLRLRREAAAIARNATAARGERARHLDRLAATLAAHDPDRVLERGYAIAEAGPGELVTSAAEARRRREFRVRFADDDVGVEVSDD